MRPKLNTLDAQGNVVAQVPLAHGERLPGPIASIQPNFGEGQNII